MKILRCPSCGAWPANETAIPTGVHAAGFATVTKVVRCWKCGTRVEGDPRDPHFQEALAVWKANLEDMTEEEPQNAEAAQDSEDSEGDANGEGDDAPTSPAIER